MIQLQDTSRIKLKHMQKITTSMIKNAELKQDWHKGGLSRIKSFIYYILFEYTCNYSANLTGPIQLMFYSMLIFSILYWIILYFSSKNHSIIKINLRRHNIPLKKYKRYQPLWALYFSIINTFNIGCGHFKLSRLITALQYEDYELMPFGIARTISGLQSLISNYLFVLWLLVCFVEPFA